MIIVFWGIWLVCFFILITTEFSSLSVLALSSLLYSTPVIWTPIHSNESILVWLVVLTFICVFQVLYVGFFKRREAFSCYLPSRRTKRINAFFNVALIFVFVVILVLSGGVSVFFEGKYAEKAGGHMLVYYTWNSLLLITAIQNLSTIKLHHPYSLACFVQLFLVFVGGDRTILFLYIMAFMAHYLRGEAPIKILGSRRVGMGIFIVMVLPVLAVSKSIYTILPDSSSWSNLFSLIFSENFWLFATKDFEPTHTHSILVFVTERGLDYSFSDMVSGIPAIFPGSSFFGIDPHKFSNAVKSTFFSSWGAEAGVGANFWAQGYAIGSYLGVMVFCLVLISTLLVLDNKIGAGRGCVSYGFFIVLVSILGFYIQRNSLEQILSFVGRYVAIFVVLYILGRALIMLLTVRK